MADTGSVLEMRRGLRAGHGDGAGPGRGPTRSASWPTTRPTWPAPSTATGADKAARFLQLCDAFDIPVLFLCDTPGIMVGPEAEKEATVRHAARLFVIGASLTVPFFTIILRKAYGLGAQAMAGGTFKGAGVHRVVADGRVRRHGVGGVGTARVPQGAGGGRRPRRARGAVPADGGAGLRAGEGAQHGDGLRDRRRDRSGRRHGRGSWPALRSAPPVPPRSGKKRPCVDTW